MAGLTVPNLSNPERIDVRRVRRNNVALTPGHLGRAFLQNRDHFFTPAGECGELDNQPKHADLPFAPRRHDL